MTFLARILTLVILVSAAIQFSACDGSSGDDPKSEKELQIEKLVGTWKAETVTYDGDDMIADYGPFQVTIVRASSEAMTFTVAGRPAAPKISPWPASGTFTFGTPVASKLLRDDNVEVIYGINATTLQLTLENYAGEGYAGGRTSTVAGDWVFTLKK